MRPGGQGEPVETTIGPAPVVADLDDGSEVVYIVWRAAGNMRGSTFWNYDGGVCEMVLDDTTAPGFSGGDCRYVEFATWQDGPILADAIGNLAVAGRENPVIHYYGWLAHIPWRITDRSPDRGASWDTRILAERLPGVLNRIEDGWCEKDTDTHSCAWGLQAYCDGFYLPGSGWWVFWDVTDPPYECFSAYSDGYKSRYTIIHNGTIYYQTNGGTIIAVRSTNEE
jgi:hypothetical protein